jgi:hypothetical protein
MRATLAAAIVTLANGDPLLAVTMTDLPRAKHAVEVLARLEALAAPAESPDDGGVR